MTSQPTSLRKSSRSTTVCLVDSLSRGGHQASCGRRVDGILAHEPPDERRGAPSGAPPRSSRSRWAGRRNHRSTAADGRRPDAAGAFSSRRQAARRWRRPVSPSGVRRGTVLGYRYAGDRLLRAPRRDGVLVQLRPPLPAGARAIARWRRDALLSSPIPRPRFHIGHAHPSPRTIEQACSGAGVGSRWHPRAGETTPVYLDRLRLRRRRQRRRGPAQGLRRAGEAVQAMTGAPTSAPVSLFYSYAHEDEDLREELCGHLKILERRGLVSAWHDRQIRAGEDWHAQIDQELQMADLVLLLVSTLSSPPTLRQRAHGAMDGTPRARHVVRSSSCVTSSRTMPRRFRSEAAGPADRSPAGTSWPKRRGVDQRRNGFLAR